MLRPLSWARRLAADAYTPPFTAPLASNAAHFAAIEPLRKMAWRRWRRALWLAFNGQGRLELDRIGPQHRRILWIHRGMPQVGDSLMDLACRVLLRGHAERIDLLIDAHLVPLFASDDVFAHAYASAADAAANEYDLVIVLSASAQSLREKVSHFAGLPYVNLHRYYTGPEFNRTVFGFHRLQQLLGETMATADIERLARPHMVVDDRARAAIDALGLPPRFIAIALGGVRDWRTYEAWPAVIAALRQSGRNEPVLLLGSANALATRDAVLAVAAGYPVIDRIDRHGLPEAFEIMRRSAVVACADGGLLHVANAASAPTVALFAERIDPAYRLTVANRSLAFYAPNRVSEIGPALVAEAIGSALDRGIDGVTVRRL